MEVAYVGDVCPGNESTYVLASDGTSFIPMHTHEAHKERTASCDVAFPIKLPSHVHEPVTACNYACRLPCRCCLSLSTPRQAPSLHLRRPAVGAHTACQCCICATPLLQRYALRAASSASQSLHCASAAAQQVRQGFFAYPLSINSST